MNRTDQIKIGLLAAILVTQVLGLARPTAVADNGGTAVDAYIVGVAPGITIDTNIQQGFTSDPISICIEHGSGQISDPKSCDNVVEVRN